MEPILPGRLMGAAAALLALLAAGCDRDRIARLEEGVATEADVRREFGEPELEWRDAGGGRTLEYDRQPEGRTNYLITIGPDGRMSALRQVLNERNFATIAPGMGEADVRRRLGKPARITPFALRGQVAWDWRYTQPPNTPMVFTVWFDGAGRVVGTGSSAESQTPDK